MRHLKFRPFAADMPKPVEGESLLGLFSRGLERTLIVKLKQALALVDVQPAGNTSGINIVEKVAEGLATLFKLDREDVVRRLHPKTQFEHHAAIRSWTLFHMANLLPGRHREIPLKYLKQLI